MTCYVFEKDLNPCSPTYNHVRKKIVTCPPNINCQNGDNSNIEEEKDIIDNQDIQSNYYEVLITSNNNTFYLEIKTSNNIAANEDFLFFIKFEFKNSYTNIIKQGNINFVLKQGFDYVKTKTFYLDTNESFLRITDLSAYGSITYTKLNVKPVA